MIRLSLYTLVSVGFLLSLVIACENDNEEDLDPQKQPQQCTVPDVVSYSKDVLSVLSVRCYSCHSSGVASGGVILDTYSGVHAQVTNGRLVGSINHTSGFHPMPQGAAKLPTCEIQKISKWVDAGAANN